MLNRAFYLDRISSALKRSRIVALLGPRQCGKTTLARQLMSAASHNYFDLEDPVSLRRLEAPMLALEALRGLVVIDEIQRRPDLFELLRVLADRRPLPARFLILGSASPALRRQSSESLAGRMETIELSPFSLRELPVADGLRHWLRGGFPLSFLARTNKNAFVWLQSFAHTFLHHDLAQMGFGVTPVLLERFWRMLTHYHGQIWNAAPFARSLGLNESTIRRYLDVLTDVFLIRQLQPWHENLIKRQVKAPKVYFRDSGVLHFLLGIRSIEDLQSHPRLGASYEGYVIEELLRFEQYEEAYFWATHSGAELDLLLIRGGRRYGYEIKRADAPGLTASMRVALEDLKLHRLTVCYPGRRSYKLAHNVTVIPTIEVIGAAS